MYSILCLPAFVSLAFSAALAPRTTTCKTFDDNYDNIAASVGPGTGISAYNGLTYKGWNAQNHASPLTPVAAHTQPNLIVATILTDLTSVGSVTLVPFGNILRGSGTKSFDAISFYFGCAQTTTQGAADIAVPCTLAVTGYDVKGKQIPVNTFGFAPPGLGINIPPNKAVLRGFSNLQNITFGVTSGSPAGGPAGTVILVDDFVHCNYS